MGKIKLSDGFTPIPEGRQIFKIVKSDYDEDFGKVEIELVTKNGQKQTERFLLVNNDGELNERALNAFSYFSKTALNNFNLEEIDHADLVGCYISANVVHKTVPSNRDPARTLTFVNLTDYAPASGFDDGDTGSTASTGSKPSKSKAAINLDDILD